MLFFCRRVEPVQVSWEKENFQDHKHNEQLNQNGVELEFLSASQDTPEGTAMREWIVEAVRPLDRDRMQERARTWR